MQTHAFSDAIGSAIFRNSFFGRRIARSGFYDSNCDGNGVEMKVKLTTKQKRDRRLKIKRRKLRRLKTGV